MTERGSVTTVNEGLRQAHDRLDRIVAEHATVLDELARAVEVDDPSLARSIRNAEPECLQGVLVWAIPHLRRCVSTERDKLRFDGQGMALLSRLGAFYAEVLLRNSEFLEWRVGEDPENPETYVYQGHPVIGVKSADTEVDPFSVVVNVVRGILRGNRKQDALLGAYRLWVRDAERSLRKRP